MHSLLLASLLSAMAGLSLGLLGGGGSILAVPILLYAAHMQPDAAITLSLLMVGTASVAATVSHARAGNVNLRAALRFGISSLIGSFVGGRLSHLVPSRLLLVLFTIIMVVTGLAMLKGRRSDMGSNRPRRPSAVLGYGVAVGLLTGLVGAGGGFIIVPVLAMFVGLSMPSAIGTSLAIIAANSLLAFAARLGSQDINLAAATVLSASSVVGSIVGAQWAAQISPAKLRQGFAMLVIAVATLMLVRQFPGQEPSSRDDKRARSVFHYAGETPRNS